MSDEAMTPRRDAGLPHPGEAAGPDAPADPTDETADDELVGHVVATDDAAPPRVPIDLARIERDLAGVESALQRLDDGTYWTDEVTGAAIPDTTLAADPVARRAG